MSQKQVPGVGAVVGSPAVLRLGSRGTAVEEQQRRLQTAGFYKGPIDGTYSATTIDAVKLFQERFNLTRNGLIEARAWTLLTGNPAARIPSPTPSNKVAGAAMSATSSVRTVKVWWNTFIPMSQIDGPPMSACFKGDGRALSNSITASHRTHQEIEIEVATSKTTINYKNVGETHEIDCTTGAMLAKATAPTTELTNGPVTRSGALFSIKFTTDASNPLVTLAPAINSEVTFLIDPVARTCSLTGQHDGFPAYEAYVTANSGAGVLVYGYNPVTAGKTISALFAPMDVTAVSTTVRF